MTAAEQISHALNWPLDMLAVSIWSDEVVESANMLLVDMNVADVVDIRPLDDELLQRTAKDETGLIKIECRLLNDVGTTVAFTDAHVFAGRAYLRLPKALEHPLARAVANVAIGGIVSTTPS